MRSLVVICACLVTSHVQIAHQQPAKQGDVIERCKVLYELLSDYIQWPFQLNCTELNNRGTIVNISKCDIKSSNKQSVSFQKGHFLPNLTQKNKLSENIYQFRVLELYNKTTCVQRTFNAESLRNRKPDCKDDILNNTRVIEKSVVYGDKLKLSCYPSDGSLGEVVFPPATFQTESWRRTTSKHPNESREKKEFCKKLKIYPSSEKLVYEYNRPTSFLILKASFYHPAIYSCKIKKGRQAAYIVHYSVCVQRKINSDRPVIKCPQQIEFGELENITIYCKVHTSNELLQPNDLEIQWDKKMDNKRMSKQCSYVNSTTTEREKIHQDIDCGIQDFTNNPDVCFKHVPSDEELANSEDDRRFLNIFLQFKNTQKSFEGFYQVRFRYKNHWISSKMIRMKFDQSIALSLIVKLLFALLTSIVLVCTIALVVWYNRIQLLLFMKRHFGSYDLDAKDYVATLSYFLSDDEQENEITKKSVLWIRELMKDLSYDFYDSYEQYQPGYTPETILSHMSRSHRIILVITPNYVTDSYSRFVAQQAYVSMLHNQTKIISVLTSGAKKALNRSIQKREQFSKELKHSIKASRNIKLSKYTKESQFKGELQYSLPKLTRKVSSTANVL